MVNLTQSELSSFCERFGNLQAIHVHSELKFIDKNLLQNCKKIKKFELYETKLRTVPENLFFGNPEMTLLGLSTSRITTLSENVFQYQHQLSWLSLNGNKINLLP